MANEEAYRIIGERAEELIKNANIQEKMLQIAAREGKEAAEKWLYMSAIATLYGF